MTVLADVFRRVGPPQITYVEPAFLPWIRSYLPNGGSPLVIEGPSGIGKTTALLHVIQELREQGHPMFADAPIVMAGARRDQHDAIISILTQRPPGVLVIDDFHRIPVQKKIDIGLHLKALADERDPKFKVVIVGIRRSHRPMLKGTELGNRIDLVEAQPVQSDLINKMIQLGEKALNVTFNATLRDKIIEASHGSLQLAQGMCFDACVLSGISKAEGEHKFVNALPDVVLSKAMEKLDNEFLDDFRKFARGPSGRPGPRMPHARLLEWVGEFGPWEVQISQAIEKYPEMQRSMANLFSTWRLIDFMGDIRTMFNHFYVDMEEQVMYIEDRGWPFILRDEKMKNFVEGWV